MCVLVLKDKEIGTFKQENIIPKTKLREILEIIKMSNLHSLLFFIYIYIYEKMILVRECKRGIELRI